MSLDLGVRRIGAPAAVHAALAVLLAWTGCASPGPVFEYRPILGTRVRLAVPDGFVPAQRFSGLVSVDGASSVIVTEIATPVEEVTSKMSEREFAARGMTWIDSEKIEVDDFDGVLVRALEKDESGMQLRRWIAVFGEDDSGIMISASTRAIADEELDKRLRDLLLTAKWDPDETVDPYEGLGFRVKGTRLLRVSDRLPAMVSFTVGGHRGRLKTGDPLFLAGTSLLKSRVTNIEAFGMSRMQEMPELEDIEVESSRVFELDGLPAHELLVETSDRPTGTRMLLYQAVVISSTRYFLLQGMVSTKESGEFLPHFRQITMSFQHTP